MGCHSGFLPPPSTTYTPPCASTSHPGSYPVLQHLPGLLQQLLPVSRFHSFLFPMSILHKTPKGILLKCNSDSCPMPSSHTHGRSSSSHLAVPSAFTFSSAWNASLQNFHGNSATAGTHSQAHSLTPPPTCKRDTDNSLTPSPQPPSLPLSIYPTSVLIAVFPSPNFSFRGS